MIDLPPWLAAPWRRSVESRETLHHALMLNGVDGIGKREYAVALAQLLLCSAPNADGACGQCRDCTLFAAGSHPDLHVLTTEHETATGRVPLIGQYSDRYQDAVAREKRANPGKVIPVDQIRSLITRFYQSPHFAANKVALITPADRMNTNAANALLKLLEEPPDSSYFILTSAYPGMLPATIRSRCLLLPLAQPDTAVSADWLARAGADNAEAIVAAHPNVGPFDLLRDLHAGVLSQRQQDLKQLVGVLAGRVDPVSLAGTLAKQDIAATLSGLHGFCVSLIRWQSASKAPAWATISGLDIEQLSAQKLHGIYDKVGQYQRMARDQLNAQLALEEVLISLQYLAQRPASVGPKRSGQVASRIVRAGR